MWNQRIKKIVLFVGIPLFFLFGAGCGGGTAAVEITLTASGDVSKQIKGTCPSPCNYHLTLELTKDPKADWVLQNPNTWDRITNKDSKKLIGYRKQIGSLIYQIKGGSETNGSYKAEKITILFSLASGAEKQLVGSGIRLALTSETMKNRFKTNALLLRNGCILSEAKGATAIAFTRKNKKCP